MPLKIHRKSIGTVIAELLKIFWRFPLAFRGRYRCFPSVPQCFTIPFPLKSHKYLGNLGLLNFDISIISIWFDFQKPSGSNPNTVSEGTANPPSHVIIPQSHFLSEGRAGSIGFINLFIFGYNPTSHYNPIIIPLGSWNSHNFLGHIPLSH
jgi:hypothetical protein